MSRIKWRNLWLFVLTLAPVLWMGHRHDCMSLVLWAYTGGVFPCAAIVRLGWLR